MVLLVVFAGVSGTVRSALGQLSEHEWQLRPLWLVIAGVLYLIGLVPMAWFWHRTLVSLGQHVPSSVTLRGYFLGHVGKYVPGKAMAVILRVATIRRWVPSMRVAILSTMMETLTMMAVGAFLAAGFSAYLLRDRPELAAIAFVTAVAVIVPTLPPVVRFLARIGAGRSPVAAVTNEGDVEAAATDTPARVDTDGTLDGVNWRLLVAGWFAAIVCWLFLGLSLWATLRAIGASDVDPVSALPRLIAAVALAVVAGFISMLPGGLGVRDLALVQLLAESSGSANALIAAVLMRLVWLVSEVAACVILYVAARRGGGRSE